MGRVLHSIEKGLKITGENSDSGVSFLFGAGVPGADAGVQDAAEVGSIYMQTNGQLYQKKTAGAGADKWERKATLSDITSLSFRSEKVRAATGQVAPITGSVINLTTTPFSDDDAPVLTAADFFVNDHVIFGVGGTPKLMRVSVVASPNVTFVDAEYPLVDNDNFVVKNYLPDSPDAQEAEALIHYNSGIIVKLGDFNWALATGISLSGAFSALAGIVTAGDTIEVALQKLTGNQNALTTLSGVPTNTTNLGTFSGDTIPDNQTIKQSIQSLETALEARGFLAGVTGITTLDSVLVDKVKCVKWLIHAFEQATPANVQAVECFGIHNGTAAADATTTDDTVFSKLKLGSTFNFQVSTDVSGAGVAQVMRLRVASSSAGITVASRRVEVY